MSAQGSPWLVVRTHFGQEGYGALNASRQGCQCYLPLVYNPETKRSSPFFPAYLFVRTPTPSFSFLESTYGISKVLRFGDTPATIRDGELRALFDRTEVIGDVRALRIVIPRFRRGQSLAVRCGILKDKQVAFNRYRPGNRVEVLFEFLGRKTRSVLPEHWVQAA